MSEKFTARIDLTNDGAEPFILWVEPWAHDFTLQPGQTFCLVAASDLEVPYFAQRNDGLSRDVVVYVEGGNDVSFTVLEGERELRCGHNRQAPSASSLPNTSCMDSSRK